MFLYLIFISMIFNSILFFNMNHPMSMGLNLMIQTMMTAMLMGMMTKTFWFSYSLFLIFIGGMLILFMYMTSLASNEVFSINMNFKKINIFIGMMILLMLIYTNLEMKILINNYIINEDNLNFFFMKPLNEQTNLMLNKMYNFPMNLITMLLVMYLFLTLIMTVKITNIFKGPLRQKI